MLNNDFNDNPDSSKMITDELPISNNIITKHFLYHTNTQLNLIWKSKIISAHSGGIGGIRFLRFIKINYIQKNFMR